MASKTDSTSAGTAGADCSTPPLRAADSSAKCGGCCKTDGAAEQTVEDNLSTARALVAIVAVAVPFFQDKRTRLKAISLAVGFCILSVTQAHVLVVFSTLVKSFVHGLMQRDEGEFWSSINKFVFLIAVIAVSSALQDGVAGIFQLEWRRYLTEDTIKKYTATGRTFYELKMRFGDIDNPDQRIGEAIGSFTGNVKTLLSATISASCVIISMSQVLNQISPMLNCTVIIGSILFTLLAIGLFGKLLMRVQRVILAQEATLRFVLVRLRACAEEIALLQGAEYERALANQRFLSVLRSCYRRVAIKTAFAGFQNIVKCLSDLAPYIVLALAFFNEKIDYGCLTQAAYVFNELLLSWSAFVAELETVSNLGAEAIRIQRLRDTLDRLNHSSIDDTVGILIIARKNAEDFVSSDCALCLQDVTVRMPCATTLLVSNFP
eukprot:TRINITY_DN24170_c0_g1_i2.p1 TRINITY_DN24170_c0_g1~~TRINITY_DN24170_c0_g1_i2.p1  ORF type:complete len:435 (+),score=68.26 TRINITY_DN24170_c0_g1_i2:54-1358(+)